MGKDSTYVVTEDRNLYSFGNNCYGQLGLGHWRSQMEPAQINSTAMLLAGETVSICVQSTRSVCDHIGLRFYVGS